MSTTVAPSLRVERRLLREGVLTLAAADEVGRGALCGPVTIGMVLIDEKTRSAPSGVRDSKLLTPAVRERLVPRIQRWAIAYGVGHASPVEIDEFGMTAALRLAGQRALAQLHGEAGCSAGMVLLDGNHDYLSAPEQDALFGAPAPVVTEVPRVVTMIKADMKCAAVAAASVLAKTARDALLLELAEEHPHYGWADNKGYSAPEHLAALLEHGPTVHHRLSWRLPGLTEIDPVAFRRAAALGVRPGVQNVPHPLMEESR